MNNSIYIPRDIRLIIYSYFTIKELSRKVSHLSRTEHRLVMDKKRIYGGRVVTINSMNLQKQTFLFSLIEKVSINWSKIAPKPAHPIEFFNNLSLLPNRLKQFNISLDLLIDEALNYQVERQESYLDSFLKEMLKNQVCFQHLCIQISHLCPAQTIYVNKLLSRV